MNVVCSKNPGQNRFQYAIHTTSFKDQPVSDRTFSRFHRRCLTYETETGIDLIHDTVKELSGGMAALMKLNDRMKRMDSLMAASNIRKLGRMELLYTCVVDLCIFSPPYRDGRPSGRYGTLL